MKTLLNKIRPVILCGGSGTRLWPVSRESLPKQFVPLINEQSLLDLTLERVESLLPPICITNEEHRFLVASALEKQPPYFESPVIILEPAGRNTAAAMAAAVHLPTLSEDEILLFLPSDHYVPDIDQFITTISAGISAAENGYLVTFGVQPNFPNTAYGYIEAGEPISFLSEVTASHQVQKFLEKPNAAKAQELFFSGKYFWNSGIFLCKSKNLIAALNECAADINEQIQKSMQASESDGIFVRPDSDLFLACRSDSIDYAVMERYSKVAVTPFNGMWSDVGSWNAVAQLSESDDEGNGVRGAGYLYESKNTYIHAGQRLVVGLGLQDMLVVDTPDAVLVAHMSLAEEIKNVVKKLKNEKIIQATTHQRVYRPWGWYESISLGEQYKVKRITVNPGAALSLQLHHHRSEHWVVVSGKAQVTNGNQTMFLSQNQSTYIPIGEIHRLENPGTVPLEIIEVQLGGYLGEDDIIRLEDQYSRC